MSKESETDELTIRDAAKEDMTAVAEMIQEGRLDLETPAKKGFLEIPPTFATFQELADFEKMSDGPKLSIKDLEQHGFESNPPAFRCKVAETPQKSIVGYALYFPTYSTWQGRSMMLEDLYVRPSQRNTGVGKRLFNSVAKEAILSGSSRLDFHVLEWNPASSFYDRRGATNLTRDERWCYYRLSGDNLHAAADHKP